MWFPAPMKVYVPLEPLLTKLAVKRHSLTNKIYRLCMDKPEERNLSDEFH